MYKRYNLSDIQKAVIELLQDNNPMSSTEISKKIGTNRITISKYLDILYFQKIINKKKIGSVNFWFLEPGIININSKDVSYIDLQQKLLTSLTNGEKEITENTILSITNKRTNLNKIIIEIFFPVLKTLFELHNRGRIGKTEKIHLLTNLIESINLINNSIITNENSTKRNSILIIVAGDDDSIPVCHMIKIFAKKNKINSMFIGNVEKYIDPFFDIDFQRYIKKIFSKSNDKIYVCICSYNEISIKFLSLALKENECIERINLIIFSNTITKEKIQDSLKEKVLIDFAKLIEIIENI
jgi:DNA-binding Lrp family transcriptional regulator